MEDQNHSLLTSMEKELLSLRSLSPLSCISKVPARLRMLNEKAYEPQIVSIGPLHHGKEALKDMEEQKWRCLKHFIRNTGVTLNDYIEIVKTKENTIRNYYAEFISFSSDDFVKLILLDAVFIIEVVLRLLVTRFKDEIDQIFDQPRNLEAITTDMILLENQIPFFIIKDIYERAQMISTINVIFLFLQVGYSFVENDNNPEMMYTPDQFQFSHILELKRKFDIPLELQYGNIEGRGKLKSLNIPTIKELHSAGVKLKVGSEKKLFNIRFDVADGILEIPKLFIQDRTEIVIRNVIAYEQCHCVVGTYYITDYFILMKGLIKSPKDLELLIKYGIVESTRESDTVAAFFQTQVIGTVVSFEYFCFATLCDNMNKYCKSSRNRWKANLKMNYFNTPWTTISVIAAAIILILTFIQTLCSLLTLKGSN